MWLYSSFPFLIGSWFDYRLKASSTNSHSFHFAKVYQVFHSFSVEIGGVCALGVEDNLYVCMFLIKMWSNEFYNLRNTKLFIITCSLMSSPSSLSFLYHQEVVLKRSQEEYYQCDWLVLNLLNFIKYCCNRLSHVFSKDCFKIKKCLHMWNLMFINY